MGLQTPTRSKVKTPEQPCRASHPRPVDPSRPVRVAVVGCGAISQQLHLPILAGHKGVQLTALVDRNVERAKEFAKGYGVANVLADDVELDPAEVDAAVVATPPNHHAPGSIGLLRRGIHVLVEKPMATSYADACAMVEAAEESGTILSVGFFRRLMPSVRMMRSLLDSRWLGKPVRFEVVAGDFYNWPAATLANMRRDLAGGGVLIDFGSHMLDLIHYLLGDESEVLAYRDNALGGVESDCSIRLRMRAGGEPIEGTVDLSRTRKLGNAIRIECAGGTLEYTITERYRIRVVPRGLELTDPLRQTARAFDLQAGWADEPDTSWYETVRLEIDDWLDAIRTGRPAALAAGSCLATARLIEECYASPQPLSEPWVQEGLTDQPRLAAGNRNGASAVRRVLVTGANGFIGSRLAEVLSLREGCEVRALVHNPGNASRLARLPVEMVQADLGSPEAAKRLVEGCDTVVHCAIGTSWGERARIFAVNVEGTRLLAEAARAAGVNRFVHFSTIAVHGHDVTGVMDEETPIKPPQGDDYSESKAEAERQLLGLARDGFPVVILRPACVYGPFSRIFITRPMEALPQGRFRLIGPGDGPSNMVYVDNVVDATLRAMAAPAETVRGEIFTIGDGDDLSWRDFYEYFASAFGYTVPHLSADEAARRQATRPRGGWWRWPFACLGAAHSLMTSAEFKALGRRALDTDPIGRLPRWALDRYPRLRRRVRKLVRADDSLPIHRRETPAVEEFVEMGASQFLVSIDKARRVLGYTPAVSRERGMQLTLEWIRHARLIHR